MQTYQVRGRRRYLLRDFVIQARPPRVVGGGTYSYNTLRAQIKKTPSIEGLQIEGTEVRQFQSAHPERTDLNSLKTLWFVPEDFLNRVFYGDTINPYLRNFFKPLQPPEENTPTNTSELSDPEESTNNRLDTASNTEPPPTLEEAISRYLLLKEKLSKNNLDNVSFIQRNIENKTEEILKNQQLIEDLDKDFEDLKASLQASQSKLADISRNLLSYLEIPLT